MATAWRAYAAVGAAASIGLLVVPAGLARDVAVGVVGLSAVVAMAVGIRRNGLRTPAWVLLTAGVALWTVGDLLLPWFEYGPGSIGSPVLADVVFLSAYVALGTGLQRMARRRRPGGDRSTVLDALIIAVGVWVVLYAAFIEPAWMAASGSLFDRLVSIAYPVGDVVLLVQLSFLVAGRTTRSPTLALLAGAFGSVLVADLLRQGAIYLGPGGIEMARLAPVWGIAYVLCGAAVLHPSAPGVTAVVPEGMQLLTVRRLVAMGISIALIPATVVVEMLLGLELSTAAVSVAGVIVIVLVLMRMIGLVRHISLQADHLERLASSDPVTGLPNRRRFAELLRTHLEETGGDLDGQSTGLVLVTVDRVAEVADILGLHTADELLTAVSARLGEEAGSGAVVARLGGETFAVLLPDVGSPEAAVDRAHAIAEAFTRPVRLSELTVTADVVVGVAVAPHDAAGGDDLLARADGALSAARSSSRRVARFAEQHAGPQRAALMTELAAALEADDVVLHFQPQVELSTGMVLGVEALVRWQHPVHGLLPPSAFVPAAERAGLIQALTGHVLDRALAQVARWRDEGLTLTVSVNLSARNLLDADFVHQVHEALVWHGVPAACLDLEITETMAMVDPARSVQVLRRLASLGVTLSVDDYGTGYSSLAYLQTLPVHRLKIDRSFVAGVTEDPASAVIVRSTVELARHLGLATIAEGVEDDDILRALRGMGCFGAQGFGIGRPVPADDVRDLLSRIGRTVPPALHEVPPYRSRR